MFTFIMLPGQGPVPVLLKELGIAEHFNLFNDIHTAMWGVALVNMWSNVGFQMIIFSSGMAAISEDVYEAAAMDERYSVAAPDLYHASSAEADL